MLKHPEPKNIHLREKEAALHYSKDIQLHTIELNRFEVSLPKKFNEFVRKVKTSLDIWSSFLTRNSLLNPEILPTDPDILQNIDFKAGKDAYEDRLKWLRIGANILKKQFNDGKAEGIEKGKKEKALGMGPRYGKRMLQCGMSIEHIADILGIILSRH